jgi:hypothetical protein
MKRHQIAANATRISIFAGSLWAILQAVAFLMHSPARLMALGVVLLLISAGVFLAACAWTLRKLWALSGIAALAIATQRTERSTSLSVAEGESEVGA